MEKRDYVVTLDSVNPAIRDAILDKAGFGIRNPTQGTDPGTTIWWRTEEDAKSFETINSKEKQFSENPINLNHWVGILLMRGFTHISIRPEWTDWWPRRRELGFWLDREFDFFKIDFRSVDWRLYRSNTQPWREAVDVRFDGWEPVETQFDPRYREYPEWEYPRRGRYEDILRLRAKREETKLKFALGYLNA